MGLALEIFIVGLCDFFILIPFMLRMLFKPVQFLHQYVTSDIPGNIHYFDPAVVCLFRTLPEPSNFNLINTRIPLHDNDVVIVRGNMPPSRMSSLSVHGNQVEAPNSMEVTPLKNEGESSRRYEIELRRTKDMPKSVDNNRCILECQDHWVNLMVIMRNYLVPPGTMVDTPEIVRKSTGEVIRKSQRLVAGASTLDVSNYRYSTKIKFALFFHLVLWSWIAYSLTTTIPFTDSNFFPHWISRSTIATVGGILFAYLLRHLMFVIGKKRLQQTPIAPVNTFGLVGLDEASTRSQPSKLHTYYYMNFDFPAGKGLRVTAKIDESRQKYWSLIIYDEYGVPLSQYVFDGNANHKNRESLTKYDVDIRLIPSLPIGANATGVTYFDLGNCRKGYAAFRLVHPKDDDVKFYSAPKVEVVAVSEMEKKHI